MNASPFAANFSLTLGLANNYYALSSLTIMFLDEKFGLAGILLMAVIVLYKLVRWMISCHCFSLGYLARRASTPEFDRELPNDILMEILVRLPVSSIFRFRSVSRSFRSLVLESHTCNRLPPVLVGILCVSIDEPRTRYVSLRKGFGDSLMDYDPTRFLRESSLCGGTMDSKFGLILCIESSYSSIIYLCNPTTKKCRSISFHGSYDHFVLAYDPSLSKHHYKVIKVAKISKKYEHGGYIFEVFSSKTGRWDRKFRITDRRINLIMDNSCFANGLLYMFERFFSSIVAINCVEGSYRRVTLPSPNRCEEVGALCNSCGSLMYSKYCRGELRVWTLVKNENESCWLLRHEINLKDKLKKLGLSFPFDTLFDGCYDFVLLFHLDSMVLRIHTEYFLYNLESNEIAVLQVDDSTVHGYTLLPWSPCYYEVAGL